MLLEFLRTVYCYLYPIQDTRLKRETEISPEIEDTVTLPSRFTFQPPPIYHLEKLNTKTPVSRSSILTETMHQIIDIF